MPIVTTADPLVALVEGRMHEAIACGADVGELAAIAVDAAVAECVGLLHLRAAQLANPRAQQVVLACVETLLSAQFSGWSPPTPRARTD